MPASNTIVLKSLSILLGLFFIFVGTLKLTPHISKDLYKDLRTEYVKYAKVFPLTALFGIKIPSKWYRRTVGILEIVCGLAMALIPYHKVKNVANVTLLLLMLLGIYQHWMVSDPFERSGPALVFTFMLGGRLVVWYQTSRKEAAELAAVNASQANGLKQE
ncbi:novel acetylcholine receptor chaperone [Drosophila sulfurigaster albostrigata]|uniref:Novel acetylcholine receptor chaperone n=1 Tax=Drosophila albomicans TaxID=7291 RepID=A0A6P8WYW2_DROAB|nr:novel acetylcholine receptor chaperone [Drosophila albomicans]XP_060658000.1 novel acetylcholine receptor chaperone [Drosophila nasuta]XP_062133123.1 novel acetylcholine receptor chaperone [Drosophila sulfurigaster albostrigata]